MKQITDGEKDYAYALGELAYELKGKLKDNPFKKSTEYYYWWRMGFNKIRDNISVNCPAAKATGLVILLNS